MSTTTTTIEMTREQFITEQAEMLKQANTIRVARGERLLATGNGTVWVCINPLTKKTYYTVNHVDGIHFNLKSLSDACNFQLTFANNFKDAMGERGKKLGFGEYRYKTIAEIAALDLQYFKWLYSRLRNRCRIGEVGTWVLEYVKFSRFGKDKERELTDMQVIEMIEEGKKLGLYGHGVKW